MVFIRGYPPHGINEFCNSLHMQYDNLEKPFLREKLKDTDLEEDTLSDG